MNRKIGIVGCGKRFQTLYFDILNSLNYDLFLWNRTKSKSEKFKNKENVTIVNELTDFESIDLDFIVCTLPEGARLQAIENLVDITTAPILVETPVTNQSLVNISVNNFNRIGVLEQWPYLPLEQFKRLIYENNIMSRPYWVFNDGRTYDYHGIAQLRSYTENAIPKMIKGAIMNVEQPGHIDNTGNLNVTSDFWTHGNVHLSNDALLTHSFCYNCKVSDLKPMQAIKCYSSDGSIVTGRIHELNNDYELAEIRYLDEHKKVIVEKIKSENLGSVTSKITAAGITWQNKYADLEFNDQQVAIATMFEMALDGLLYSPNAALIDCITVNAIKESGLRHQILSTSK